MKSADHLGSDRLAEVLIKVGGRMIPLVTLLNLCCHQNSSHGLDTGLDTTASTVGRKAFPLDASIGYLLSSQRLNRLAFPVLRGLLQWVQGLSLAKAIVTHTKNIDPRPKHKTLTPDQNTSKHDWNLFYSGICDFHCYDSPYLCSFPPTQVMLHIPAVCHWNPWQGDGASSSPQ